MSNYYSYNMDYDYPFNWSYLSNPLGSILDPVSSSSDDAQVVDWYLNDQFGSEISFPQILEQQYGGSSSPADGGTLAVTEESSYGKIDNTPILVNDGGYYNMTKMDGELILSIDGDVGNQKYGTCFDLPPSPEMVSYEEVHKSEPMDMEEEGEDYSVYSTDDPEVCESELSKVKLQASKSPIMDALVYCALNRWGIELLEDKGDNIRFRVFNFQKYYKYSGIICAKQNPTEDMASRIKALKRWFPDFPTKRAGNLEEAFEIIVQAPSKQDNKPQKLHEIIEKQRRLLGLHKITRQG